MPDQTIANRTAVSALLGTHVFPIGESGLSKSATGDVIAAYLLKRINGNSGAAGAWKTLQKLSSNSSDNTAAATPAVVMTTTGVGVGTWNFKYTVIYQTAATGTGCNIFVNHTGTATQFASWMEHCASIATASNGIGATVNPGTTGGVLEARPESALNTQTAKPVGVVSANTDVMAIIQGVLVVSVSGDLQLKINTEVDTSAVRLMADSHLELTLIG